MRRRRNWLKSWISDIYNWFPNLKNDEKKQWNMEMLRSTQTGSRQVSWGQEQPECFYRLQNVQFNGLNEPDMFGFPWNPSLVDILLLCGGPPQYLTFKKFEACKHLLLLLLLLLSLFISSWPIVSSCHRNAIKEARESDDDFHKRIYSSTIRFIHYFALEKNVHK